ncbi:MAG: thioether cross-link-forming SCIFF peptide maturase [Clostridia bacterium]
MIHAFTFKNIYLAIDVHSGAVHQMDKQAYDVVRAIELGEPPYELPYPSAQIDEICAELDELRDANQFDSPEQTPPESAGGQVIKAMCLHVAHDCNLRCKYCFADTGEFHGKRMIMSEETGCRALDFLIEHSGKRHNLEVDLFGGEPLVNFDVLRAIVTYGRQIEKRYDKHINFTCTTNCVALNDEMMDFLNEQMHNIVLSIDGRRDIHDALRPTVSGKGSYDIIVPKAQELVRRRGDKEYYVRGTFTNRNLDFTKDVESLQDLGFDQISMEPVVLAEDSPYAILEKDVARVLEEYDVLADFLLKRRGEGRWFNFFHFMVDMDAGPCLKKRISGCGAGTEYVAVTPDGDIYPCHQFVGEEGFCMGNVLNGKFDETMQQRFQKCNILTKPECNECWAKYFCSGGCAANAYKYNGDIMKPYAITCAFEKKRTECAIGIYAAQREKD